MGIFDSRNYLELKQCLTGCMRRHEFLAQNIANLSTPGYQRKDFNFRSQLLALREGGFNSFGAENLMISPGAAEPVSGGGVDPSMEMSALMQNSLEYKAFLRLTEDYLKGLRAAIYEGRR